MPIIDLNLRDMEKLIGIKMPVDKEKLNDIFQYVGGEVEDVYGDELKLEIKCRNRPDIWYAEGIAKELKGAFGKENGLLKLKAEKSNYKVIVNKNIKKIRPYIGCVVLKGCKLSDNIIKQIMQQQDKIDGTYGRKRKKTSIGIYNFDLLEFPLYYKAIDPEEVEFVPLDMDRKMTPKKALLTHPKGREYAHLLKGHVKYPIFMDSKKQVLSFPPIINSNDLGKIKYNTKNILIEVTGTEYEAVQNVLVMMAISFIARGGKAYEVHIDYPKEIFKKDTTPKFEVKEKKKISTDYVNSILGTDFKANEIKRELEKARFGVKVKGKEIKVEIPSYRTDIIHDSDLVEDIAIMYGYNKLPLSDLELASEAGLSEITKFSDKIREFLIGFKAQEVLNFTLTSDSAIEKSGVENKNIRIENPINENYSILRKELFPGILEFLSKNTKKEFPQVIFEVGDCVEKDSKRETNSKQIKKVCFAICKDKVTFTEIKQILESLANYIGKELKVEEKEKKSFISGRCGKILENGKEIGIIGEIHPEILKNWGMSVPIALFEIEIGEVF